MDVTLLYGFVFCIGVYYFWYKCIEFSWFFYWQICPEKEPINIDQNSVLTGNTKAKKGALTSSEKKKATIIKHEEHICLCKAAVV